jgi:hypothetical protein
MHPYPPNMCRIPYIHCNDNFIFERNKNRFIPTSVPLFNLDSGMLNGAHIGHVTIFFSSIRSLLYKLILPFRQTRPAKYPHLCFKI